MVDLKINWRLDAGQFFKNAVWGLSPICIEGEAGVTPSRPSHAAKADRHPVVDVNDDEAALLLTDATAPMLLLDLFAVCALMGAVGQANLATELR